MDTQSVQAIAFSINLIVFRIFFEPDTIFWTGSFVTEGIVTEGNLSTSLICIKEPDFSFLLLPFYSKITDFVSSINHLGQWHELGKRTDIRGVFDTKKAIWWLISPWKCAISMQEFGGFCNFPYWKNCYQFYWLRFRPWPSPPSPPHP